MEYGFARVSFVGAETVVQVIFGPENCEPILGVVALENTGITVDPATRPSTPACQTAEIASAGLIHAFIADPLWAPAQIAATNTGKQARRWQP